MATKVRIEPLLLVLSGLMVVIFLGLVVFGPDFGRGFGSLSQRKSGQASEARGKPLRTTATLAAVPNPVVAYGGTYSITGSGFTPNQMVSISFADPGCCGTFNILSDGSGNLFFNMRSRFPGTYNFEAYQQENRRLVLKAAISFSVIAQ